jgi:hypothetical protein
MTLVASPARRIRCRIRIPHVYDMVCVWVVAVCCPLAIFAVGNGRTVGAFGIVLGYDLVLPVVVVLRLVVVEGRLVAGVRCLSGWTGQDERGGSGTYKPPSPPSSPKSDMIWILCASLLSLCQRNFAYVKWHLQTRRGKFWLQVRLMHARRPAPPVKFLGRGLPQFIVQSQPRNRAYLIIIPQKSSPRCTLHPEVVAKSSMRPLTDSADV